MIKLKQLPCLIFLVFSYHFAAGQNLNRDTLFVPDQLRQYQFQLEEPVRSIENLRYEKSGEPIKGTLSPDGKKVVMDNYKKGQRVKVGIVFPDGRKEEVSKSPCFIDPVSYEL